MSTKFRVLFVLMVILGVFLTVQISESFAGCGHHHRQVSSIRYKLNNETDPRKRAKLRNQLSAAIKRGRACDSREAEKERARIREEKKRAERERAARLKQQRCRREKAAYNQAKARYNKCARNAVKLAMGKCGTPPVWNSWNNSCN